MKKLVVLLVVLSLAFVGCQAGKAVDQPKEEKPLAEEKKEEVKEEPAGEKNPVAGITLKDFKAKDVNGNEIDATVFEGKKLTVLNLWGTFCGPCIEEMPDLEKVSEKYKDKDVQMIGIVGDRPSADDAKKMLDRLKVTYTNILPDDQLMDQLVNKFDYVPVTVFVNEDGKILDTFIPGSTDERSLSSIIDKLLDK